MHRILAGTAVLLWAAAASAADAAPDVDPDWLGQAQRGIEAREYLATDGGHGLQAPNRAQGFRTRFSEDGIELLERTTEAAPLAQVRLAAVGRSRAMRSVGPGALGQRDARVEIARRNIVEWYENRPEGLEQGFTLAARPAGGGPLLLELAVQDAQLESTPDGLRLRGATRELNYTGLSVHDADGKALAASVKADGDRIRLTVKDADATYPLTIDTVFSATSEGTLLGVQAGAYFGFSVAAAGDVNADGYGDVIIGASAYQGTFAEEGFVFIYFGGPGGSFNTTADASMGPGSIAGARFGASVAGAGDVNGDGYADVIVGAPFSNNDANPGRAYLYFGGPGVFNTVNDGLLTTGQDDWFGVSVAGAGDVNGDGYADVVVGAYEHFPVSAASKEGAAYVYLGGAGAFDTSSDATLTGAPLAAGQAGAGFGFNVAGAGDVNGDGYADVIVGAPYYDLPQVDEGLALLYLGGPGAFDPGADALLEANQGGASLGNAVAGAGDVNGDGYADLIIGASSYDGGAGLLNEGAALIYFGGTGAFDTVPDQQLDPNQADANFGVSVAGAGDVDGDGYADVIVGAQLYNGAMNDTGAAFFYRGGPGTFDDIADSSIISTEATSRFGFSVAGGSDLNGDGYSDVLVGARLGGATDSGYARVYLGSAKPFTTSPESTLERNQESADLGTSVSGAGDVNGDGFSDILVGATRFDNGETNEGAAFLYFGGSGPLDATADAVLDADVAEAQLGTSVAGAGDVNGDGYADVIVGAPLYVNGQANGGAAYVYFGSAGSFDTTADAILESNLGFALLGSSVAGAGDVNGDGYADVIVGAPYYSNGQQTEGIAYLYFGGAGAFDLTPDALLERNQSNTYFGTSVAGAGDVNGDGYGDVIVGAPNFANGQLGEGVAFVYFGGAGAFDLVHDALLELNQSNASFGQSVASAGDYNADGYADVIVGAPSYTSVTSDEGAVAIYLGGSGTFNPTYFLLTYGSQSNQGLGWSVAGAGDVNGDGYGDVITGNYQYSPAGLPLAGLAGVGYGAPSVSGGGASLMGSQAGARLGQSVSGAGDVNGDGFADVIVGAPGYANGQAAEGAGLVYFGGRSGRLVQASQYRGDGSQPVEPWGLSQDADSFVVAMEANSPRGRERVKLEIETCAASSSFGGLLCKQATSPTWTDLGANAQGATLTLSATGLNPNVEYHWRARVLYAPLTSAPPLPAHGPWRRLQANGNVADIRTGVSVAAADGVFANGFE